MAINYASSAGAAEEVAAAVVAAGGEAMVVGANVGKREEIDRMFKEVMDKWGRVDVLVNNAGACVCVCVCVCVRLRAGHFTPGPKQSRGGCGG